MAGSPYGGAKAAITNKEKYGQDFYVRIGSIGGKASGTGGFAKAIPCTCEVFSYQHYVRQCAGKRGGRISKRGKMR